MKEYRLRSDLERAVVEGFAMPLGFTGDLPALRQGYTVSYNGGEGDDPDTYLFQAVVSHERLADLCRRCFVLLPEEVFAIFEIGSRDAYRSVDVYLGREAVDREQFLDVWDHFEPFLLEDGSIAAGANADEPFVEVFIDQRKAVVLHVPLALHDDVEKLLHDFGLEKVPETWPDAADEGPEVRPVLDVADQYSPDLDEMLLLLRYNWKLELNLDPDTNVDEAGRELGHVLWHVVVIVYSERDPDNAGGYLSVWLAAASLAEAEEFVRGQIVHHPGWVFGDIYTVDRVAFDERPDELGDIPPRPTESGVYLTSMETWGEDD